MVIRKIDKMHELFGKSEQDQCKDCMHLIRNGYTKCAIYGETHSEATDWKQKQTACGLFNKAFAKFDKVHIGNRVFVSEDRVLEIIDEKIKFLEGRLQDGRFPIVKFAYQALRKDIEKLRGKEQ